MQPPAPIYPYPLNPAPPPQPKMTSQPSPPKLIDHACQNGGLVWGILIRQVNYQLRRLVALGKISSSKNSRGLLSTKLHDLS